MSTPARPPEGRASSPGEGVAQRPEGRSSFTPAPQPRWRIAFIARRFGARFGGAEAYAEHLLRQLSLRHDVHVFCQEWDSPLDLPRTILPRPRGWPRWLNLWNFSRRCARLTKGFDIVHSHENAPAGDIHGVHVMPVRYSRRQRDRTVWRRVAT
ncbi:MAG: glycosyltransferase, partial [Pigmentiphaga sp.]